MGYRSEVAITIHNEAFNNLVEKAKAENSDAYGLIKDSSIYKTDKFTTMYFDSVKWYDDYPDVQFIESFMKCVPYMFKRVGEEYEDIECLEDGIEDEDHDIYDCVYIVRSINIESAGEEINIDGEQVNGNRQEAV